MAILITVANGTHQHYAGTICQMMKTAAKARGTGIAERDPAYIESKMKLENAIIAFDDSTVIGFCYIETWSHGKYVANSGLIVHPEYRKIGLAKAIKTRVFALSRQKYPTAKIFGITTGLAVMKINSAMGYKPVTFSELTTDNKFWEGCQGCRNYDILTRTNHRLCLCTAMLYDPSQEAAQKQAHKTEDTKDETEWTSLKPFLKSS